MAPYLELRNSADEREPKLRPKSLVESARYLERSLKPLHGLVINAPYAAALAAELMRPGLDHLNLFQNVKKRVLASHGRYATPLGKQWPYSPITRTHVEKALNGLALNNGKMPGDRVTRSALATVRVVAAVSSSIFWILEATK